MQYACVAATEGRARCRNFVGQVGKLCTSHGKLIVEGKEIELALFPDTVLVKFNINPSWTQVFEEAGVPRKAPSEVSLEEKHINHAHKAGRDPYRYRDIADSGVPVFGTQGLSEVSVSGLLIELLEAGYKPQGVHIRTRMEKRFDVLVVPLVRGAESSTLSEKAVMLLERFLRSPSWGFAHIWANPPDVQGKIIHTVNLGHRKPEGRPELKILFSNGLWAVSVV